MGGDHKCPLCSATFTRPQHVGRHLRAHTGDRPYECKECPLRFARSDLLSRHVNKAHKAPDGSVPEKKPNKKGRRKSFPASALSATKPAVPAPAPGSSTDTSPTQLPAQPPPPPGGSEVHPPQHGTRERPRSASMVQQPQLQAQRMYPHHPLLVNAAPSHQHHPTHPTHAHPSQHPQQAHHAQHPQHAQSWNANPSQAFAATAGMVNHLSMSPPFQPVIIDPLTGTAMGSSTSTGGQFPAPPVFDPPFTAQPMRMSGSDQGFGGPGGPGGQPGYGDAQGQGLQVMYEWGFKKRACDQCNSSKVKCDSGEPCLRCTHRNISCTYVKPQRARTVGSYPLVPSQAPGPPAAPYTLAPSPTHAMSVSPQSHFSSPHSMESPIAPTEPVIYRKPSVASLPVNLGMGASGGAGTSGGALSANSTGTVPGQGMSGGWNAYPQQMATGATWPGPMPIPSMPMSMPIPSMGPLPAGTAPGSITGQLLESPGTLGGGMQSFPGLQPPHPQHGGHSGQGQGPSQRSSPQNLMPTPSLASNTTSPSDLDEPAERRGSRGSYRSVPGSIGSIGGGGAGGGAQWTDKGKQVEAHGGLQPSTLTLPYSSMSPPAQISPTQASPTQNPQQQQHFVNPFHPGSTYAWPQAAGSGVGGQGQGQGGWQVRGSFSSDDDGASVSALSSSANSTFFEIGDAQMEDMQQRDRRRSSQGQWANALGQLSLQDGQKAPGPAAVAGRARGATMNIPEPFRESPQRRTTFPTLSGVKEFAPGEALAPGGMPIPSEFDPAQAQGLATVLGQGLTSANLSRDGTLSGDENGGPVPSLSDVKDLWRLFMAEPMAGMLTPAGEKMNGMEDFSVTVNAQAGPSGASGNGGGAALGTPRPAIGKRSLSKSSSMPDLHSPMVNGPAFFSTFLNGMTPRPGEQQAASYLLPHQPRGAAGPGAGGGGGAGGDGKGGVDGEVVEGDMGKWSKEIQQRGSSFSLSGKPGVKLGKGVPSYLQPNAASHAQVRPAPSVVQRSSALDQTLAPERVPSFGMPSFEPSSGGQFAPHPSHAHAHPHAANPQLAKLVSGEARPGAKRLASQTLTSEAGKKASFSVWGDEGEGASGASGGAGQAATAGQGEAGQGQGQAGVDGQGQSVSMFYPNWTLNAGTTAS
ncbi:hypothetical protein IAT38_007720 [Cryptococcus sp. DSM 104549]